MLTDPVPTDIARYPLPLLELENDTDAPREAIFSVDSELRWSNLTMRGIGYKTYAPFVRS